MKQIKQQLVRSVYRTRQPIAKVKRLTVENKEVNLDMHRNQREYEEILFINIQEDDQNVNERKIDFKLY